MNYVNPFTTLFIPSRSLTSLKLISRPSLSPVNFKYVFFDWGEPEVDILPILIRSKLYYSQLSQLEILDPDKFHSILPE